jgi:hypothetical protein
VRRVALEFVIVEHELSLLAGDLIAHRRESFDSHFFTPRPVIASNGTRVPAGEYTASASVFTTRSFCVIQ